MVNFDYQTPTRLIFGKGVVSEKLASVMNQYGKRVLITYGGSIKRTAPGHDKSLYDLVKDTLTDKQVFELGGIQPNPKFNPSVLDGVRMCQDNDIDVILAVGGGSVLDCTKAIAGVAGTLKTKVTDNVEEAWDIVCGRKPTTAAVPIVDIITMAATGSEYDMGGVISRTETNDKLAYFSKLVFPAVSFIDPTYTFTLPSACFSQVPPTASTTSFTFEVSSSVKVRTATASAGTWLDMIPDSKLTSLLLFTGRVASNSRIPFSPLHTGNITSGTMENAGSL